MNNNWSSYIKVKVVRNTLVEKLRNRWFSKMGGVIYPISSDVYFVYAEFEAIVFLCSS